MAPNRDFPHVLVMPEDEHNREMANGFLMGLPSPNRQIQVLPSAGGWKKALETVSSQGLASYPRRFLVLLVDFDRDPGRPEFAASKIPGEYRERVFVIGSLHEPKDLVVAGLGSREKIGLALAEHCQHDTNDTWSTPQLQHDTAELARLRVPIRPILFP